jgi:predicted nucleic acid-binding protein
MVERLTQHIKPLSMTKALYRQAMRRCADRGERSGAIVDALHLVAAEASRSEVLVTLNPADFERLAGEQSPRIIVPPDPPRVTA